MIIYFSFIKRMKHKQLGSVDQLHIVLGDNDMIDENYVLTTYLDKIPLVYTRNYLCSKDFFFTTSIQMSKYDMNMNEYAQWLYLL